MGHSTTRAALIYQHRTSLRDKMIADEISSEPKPNAPNRARNGHKTMMRPRDCSGAVLGKQYASYGFALGAGDGNRTRTISLGS